MLLPSIACMFAAFACCLCTKNLPKPWDQELDSVLDGRLQELVRLELKFRAYKFDSPKPDTGLRKKGYQKISDGGPNQVQTHVVVYKWTEGILLSKTHYYCYAAVLEVNSGEGNELLLIDIGHPRNKKEFIIRDANECIRNIMAWRIPREPLVITKGWEEQIRQGLSARKAMMEVTSRRLDRKTQATIGVSIDVGLKLQKKFEAANVDDREPAAKITVIQILKDADNSINENLYVAVLDDGTADSKPKISSFFYALETLLTYTKTHYDTAFNAFGDGQTALLWFNFDEVAKFAVLEKFLNEWKPYVKGFTDRHNLSLENVVCTKVGINFNGEVVPYFVVTMELFGKNIFLTLALQNKVDVNTLTIYLKEIIAIDGAEH